MRARLIIGAMLAVAACADEEPPPQAVVAQVVPSEICPDRDRFEPTYVEVLGEHLAGPLDVTWDGEISLRSQPLIGDTGEVMAFRFSSGGGGPAALGAPYVYDLVIEDEWGRVTEVPDALTQYGTVSASLSGVTGADVLTVELAGGGFYGDMEVTLETSETLPVRATTVDVESYDRIVAELDVSGVDPGTYALTVANPGGCAHTIVSAITVD